MDYFFGHQPNGPPPKISGIFLALFAVTFFFFGTSTALVNRPKFMVLKKHRDEPGWSRVPHPMGEPAQPTAKHPPRTTRHGGHPDLNRPGLVDGLIPRKGGVMPAPRK